jgi:hypothetical protein
MAISSIRAAVSYSFPIASVTVSESGAIGLGTVPLSAVQWINIVYSVEVDYRGLNPVLSEIAIVVTDEVAKGFSKRVTEAQSATDELQPFVIDKALREDKTLTELVVYDFRKEFSDLVDATDDLLGEANVDDDQVMFFVKGATQDYVSTSDSDLLEFGKGINDSTSAADSDPIFIVSKGLLDQSSASDSLGFNYQKPLSGNEDIANASDEIALSMHFNRSLTDSADATDDFDGVATSEDDQTMSIAKARTELVSPTDLLSFLFGSTLQDSWTVSDQHITVFGKGLTDSASTSELQVFNINKVLADVVSTSETFDESITAETVNSENTTVSESSSLLTEKGLADSASTGDSGSLRMQGYCDDSYFAEIYLGISLTF